MNTNVEMEVNTFVGINLSGINSTMVVTINNAQEAGFRAKMINKPMVPDYTQMHLNMPKLDGLIMATSAGKAIRTTMYHLGEGHNVTNKINKLYLSRWWTTMPSTCDMGFR